MQLNDNYVTILSTTAIVALHLGSVHQLAENAAGALGYYPLHNSPTRLSKGNTVLCVRYELNIYIYICIYIKTFLKKVKALLHQNLSGGAEETQEKFFEIDSWRVILKIN
jgi:hypothetical protein